MELNAQSSRIWATYFGGSAADYGASVVTDTLSGAVYVVGLTASSNGIASGGFQNTYGGGGFDAFLVKFSATGTRIWGTYYGGPAREDGCSSSY